MALIGALAKIAICKSTDALLRALRAGRSMLVTNAYRPELHYMRGPGPRTRELGKSARRY
jgi:hypothetical protein